MTSFLRTGSNPTTDTSSRLGSEAPGTGPNPRNGATAPSDRVTLHGPAGQPPPTLQSALTSVAALARAASARASTGLNPHEGAAGLAVLDAAIEASRVDLDPDHDGMLTDQERVLGTDPGDADSDDDGIADFVDGLGDSDGDGLRDALDPDSDDDGVFDGTETGLTRAGEDTDVSKGHFVADSDPTTTSSPVLADSDADGLRDGEEDTDRDGLVDRGESDPATQDSDRDGVPDDRERGLWFRILAWWRARG